MPKGVVIYGNIPPTKIWVEFNQEVCSPMLQLIYYHCIRAFIAPGIN